MVKYGNVQRAFLGVSYLDSKTASREELEKLGLDKLDGVYIQQVNRGGAAEESGLKAGDIITRIGSKDIKTGPHLTEAIAQYRPGDKTTVTYIRNGNSNSTNITFRNKVGNTDIVKNDPNSKLGASFRELSKIECKQFGVKGGVQVSAIQSSGLIAQQTRLKNNFIITQINDDVVNTMADFQKALNSGETDIQLGGVYPNIQGIYYYPIRLE
jgi:S1-C subfamily serine protease